jgi:hypothetical protein
VHAEGAAADASDLPVPVLPVQRDGPQLIFWVGYTIVLGALAGSIAAVVIRRR